MKKLLAVLSLLPSLAFSQSYREVLIDMHSSTLSRQEVEANFTKVAGPALRTNLIAGRFLTMLWSASRDFTPLVQEQAKGSKQLSWQGFNDSVQAQAVAVPEDFLWSVQWSLNDKNVGINLLAAWEYTQGNSSAVAVVDSGLTNHIDMAGKILPGFDFVSDPSRSNDGDGIDSDASDPGNYGEIGECTSATSPSGNTILRPSSWHGTAVSGIIAAKAYNGQGMVGISQGAKILPIRAMGKCGTGNNTDIINGVAWAAGMTMDPVFPKNPNPVRIINMSLGSTGTCGGTVAAFYKEVVQLGVVVVASAGNDASSQDKSPASCPGVIAVGSHDSAGNRATYSNFGFRVDISAPGGDQASTSRLKIPTTINTGSRGPVADGYNGLQGTSFSAPHVAGVVQLMLSKNPKLTVGQVSWLLERSARPFLVGTNCYQTRDCGAGMLDAAAALKITPEPALASTGVADIITAVEYYYPPEDRYFLSTDGAEQAAIDAGLAGGFVRTGMQFKAFTTTGTAFNTLVSVCRFYGRLDSPGPNSHFFTANASECKSLVDAQAFTPSSQPRWNFEGYAFKVYPAANGSCGDGQKPVYRAYNNGFQKGKASNHRLLTDLTTYQGMAAKGWALEGVAMCAL